MLKIQKLIICLVSVAVLLVGCIGEKSSSPNANSSKSKSPKGFRLNTSDITAMKAKAEWRTSEDWDCQQNWWVSLPMEISNLRNRLMLQQSPKQEKFTEHQSARLLVGTPSVGRAPGAIEMKALIFEEDGQRFLEIAWNSNGGHISCEYIGLSTDASLEDLIQFEEHIDVEDDNPLVCTISGQEIYLQSRGRK